MREQRGPDHMQRTDVRCELIYTLQKKRFDTKITERCNIYVLRRHSVVLYRTSTLKKNITDGTKQALQQGSILCKEEMSTT